MFKEIERRWIGVSVAFSMMAVIVAAALSITYTLTVAHGLEIAELVLLVHMVLTVFSASILVFWIGRYRQTNHDIETLRKKTERKIHRCNETEHDVSERRNMCGRRRK